MIIKHPLTTEKSMKLMEAENTLVFIVDKRADKPTIRDEVEKLFEARVARVNTAVDRKGRKRAFVKFAQDTPAIDLATKLGMM